MDRPTANEWLSILEASGQVVLLEPWFSNRTKSIVKSPKLYLADTGLLCALLNIRSKDMLRQSPAAGAVWERSCWPSCGIGNPGQEGVAAYFFGATGHEKSISSPRPADA